MAQTSRLSSAIDGSRRTPLPGNAKARLGHARDLGPAPDSLELHLTLHLKPDSGQQRDLARLLAEQQSPASPNFHQWLTPEQFADRFGVSPADIHKIAAWLEAQGFTIRRTARGRLSVTFSGSAAQVQKAFGAAIHRFDVAGEERFANVSDPAIPSALAGIVADLKGLNNFPPASNAMVREPDQTTGGLHSLAPGDLAMIYDIAPLYRAGIDGSGQKMAIIGGSNLSLTDLEKFRSVYNLPGQDPAVTLVPDLPDPGTITQILGEVDLDLEWAQAVARNAAILYVYSEDPFDALAWVVDQNLAPVVSSSYDYGCEAQNLDQFTYLQQLAQQAAAEGITWVNAAGDAGAAGCDDNGSSIASNGKAVRIPGSVPEVVSVGGTQFDDSDGVYWDATNGANSDSAISYIPELAWNSAPQLGSLWAGAGGASMYYPKPAWQTGPGVPADGHRDVPDVSLAASFASDGYNIIYGGRAAVAGGTSAGTPVFAAIVTLLNQYLVARGTIARPGLGNLNPALYAAARANPGAFHDITAGNNDVPCAAASPDCSAGIFGFAAGAGYDLATGLGSPDAYNLIAGWAASAPSGSLEVLSVDANPVYRQAPDAQGNAWVVKLTVTEEGGAATALTDFQIDGVSYAAQIADLFGSTSLPAFGTLSATIGAKTLPVPVNRVFTLYGRDASGKTWTQSISVSFLGSPPAPVIQAAANGASWEPVFAPGMIVSVFGAQLAPGTQQAAATPLLDWMSGAYALINDFYVAPLYYVSPSQINAQIPYEVPAGNATLTVYNGLYSATWKFLIAESAPGIFTDANGAPVPQSSGAPGQTITIFITGAGQVAPAVKTGAAPSPLAPVSLLPAPVLPVRVTLGGVAANTSFIGIPYSLVGVTQITFTVPAVAPGPQPLVVEVGTAVSQTARFTVTPN